MIKLQKHLDDRDRAKIAGALDTGIRVLFVHQMLSGALMFMGHYHSIDQLSTGEVLGVFGADLITLRLLWGPPLKIADAISS